MNSKTKFWISTLLIFSYGLAGQEAPEGPSHDQERAFEVCMNHMPAEEEAACRALSVRGQFDLDAVNFCNRNSRIGNAFESPTTSVYTCLNFVVNKEFRRDSLDQCEEATDASASRRACLEAYLGNRKFNSLVTNYCTQGIRFLQEHRCIRDLSRFEVKAREANFCTFNSSVLADRSVHFRGSGHRAHYMSEERSCIHFFTARDISRRDLNRCRNESYVSGISQYSSPLACVKELQAEADSSLANSSVIDRPGVVCGAAHGTCDPWALDRFPWEQASPERAPANAPTNSR